VAARRTTDRDDRRRRLGQNFLLPERAREFVSKLGICAGDLVVEIGAGAGVVTVQLAATGADVLAFEVDPVWADRARRTTRAMRGRVRIVERDFLTVRLPGRPFRAVGCVPFGETTAILRRLLGDPRGLTRADLIVQLEVARKRAEVPPSTLLSTAWAPWWTFHSGARIERTGFRPVPRVDAAVLTVSRRDPPLLPDSMRLAYAGFVRANWPFSGTTRAGPATG
jgi:23S rRNA (adenine-N6)-dimethyltransferase